MNRLVIASHNEGKVREIRALLAPLAIEVLSAAALDLPEPEETGQSFVENATLKSEAAAKRSGHVALADDSGLCVPALGGAPGIYSARWAGADKNFMRAAERIRTELEAKGEKAQGALAYFICVLSLTSPAGVTQTFEGIVHGTLTFPARGEQGFGYDPIFIPSGGTRTFAEMAPLDKHALSHRARAFEQLSAYLRSHALDEAV